MKTRLLLLFIFNVSIFNAQYNFEQLDILNGFGSSSPHSFAELNGKLYFSAYSNSSGRELWVTDGTIAGTSLVKDINTNGDSDPRRLTVVNNVLYFTADTPNEGRELWKTDGTEAGTVLVKDILTGTGDGVTSSYEPFKILNNKIVFVANVMGISNGPYMFQSDGTEQETKPIATNVEVNFSLDVEYDMVVYEETLYFEASKSIGTSIGKELWKWNKDNLNGDAILVKDIRSGSASSSPSELTVYNNEIYFVANDGSNGKELWKTDGTSTNTTIVKDIRSGGSSSFNNYAKFKVYKNKLYFIADDGANGREIWITDGTEQGTQLFIDINATSNQYSIEEGDITQQLFFIYNDKMYFKATNTFSASNLPNNIEPWVTDGTVQGTTMIADLNPNGSSLNTYNSFFVYNDKLLFTGVDFNDSTKGTLWAYDFNNTPVSIAPNNVTSADVSTDFYKPIVFNNSLYFAAEYEINNTQSGEELWKLTDSNLSTSKEGFTNLEFNIYPNPASDLITINSKNVIDTIEIYNLLGERVVLKGANKSKLTLNISSLSKGIYLVKLKKEHQEFYKKLIIE